MQKFKDGLAVLGGPQAEWPQNWSAVLGQARAKQEMLLGVDRGSWACLQAGFAPDLAVGDFDSVSGQELAQIEQAVPDRRYSKPEKDLTDSELMLQAAFFDYHLQKLTVLGATGGRLDHFLVNLLTFCQPMFRPFAERVTLLDRQNRLQFFLPGQHRLLPKSGYDYLGLAALQPVADLSIQGAKYDLPPFSSSYPVCFSSNEFLPGQSVELTFKKGLVAAIYSRD